MITLILILLVTVLCFYKGIIIDRKFEKVFSQFDKMYKLFSHQFVTTDKTIIQERKNTAYWKQRAIKAEKKRLIKPI